MQICQEIGARKDAGTRATVLADAREARGREHVEHVERAKSS